MRDGLHLSGKWAGVFADGLKRTVDSGLGNVLYLKKTRWAGGIAKEVSKRTRG